MYTQYDKYCPHCRDTLYPADVKYLEAIGVCSGCVTWDRTPDKRFAKAWNDHLDRTKNPKKFTKVRIHK